MTEKARQMGFDEISEEWKGMPEFVQEKKKPYRTMKMNFRNEEDFKAFCKLVGLDTDLKESVKSAWFPKLERGEHSNLRWVDANEGDTETINDEADNVLG